MVATHNFHKLVFSARLLLKKASWGYCVLMFDSSGEPAAPPRSIDSCAPGCSETEFEVRRTTSCKEVADATVNARMDRESGMGYFYFCIRRDLSRFPSLSFSVPAEVPVANFGEGTFPERLKRRGREDHGVPE